MTTKTFDVLMVEDDREQADLIIDTARLCRSEIRWAVAEDGETALERLREEGRFCRSGRPDLVLLDLHLPGVDGVDVLRTLKSDIDLRSLPVIIMSQSREKADIDAAYELGANGYIAKPGSFEGLCSLVRFLEAFLALPHAESSPLAKAELPTPQAPTIN